ncbi:MAG: hypothetical protein ABJF50_01205 [Paracoccaceae bacterium]
MLKSILLANAASCLGFGALFAAFPSKTADFIGDPPVWFVSCLGLGLIANGAHLIWVARKDTPRSAEVLQFVVGDAVWFLATFALIGLGVWITTPHGVWVSATVAIWVAACGAGQFLYRPSGLATQT